MVRRALLIALLSAIAAVTLFFLYVRRYEQEASGGAAVQVLVALRPLERGNQVTDDALGVREIPQAYVEDRAVRAAEKSKVLGLRVGGLVQAQQTLMWTDLSVASEERRELSALVQPGRRAATIRVQNDAMGSLVLPGDSVDVIAVVDDDATSKDRTAKVLLQQALVLAVGNSMVTDSMDSQGAAGTFGDLTLSVTLAEAQLLSIASESGPLSVAVRHVDDTHTSEHVPEVSFGKHSQKLAKEATALNRPIELMQAQPVRR
jgi:pilus assembly protein CpaB